MNSVIKLDHQDIAESSTLRYDIAMEDERIAKVFVIATPFRLRCNCIENSDFEIQVWLQTRSIEMDAFRKCPVIVEGDAVVNVVDPEDNEYLVNLACATTEKIAETLSSARKFALRVYPFPEDRRKCWNRYVYYITRTSGCHHSIGVVIQMVSFSKASLNYWRTMCIF